MRFTTVLSLALLTLACSGGARPPTTATSPAAASATPPAEPSRAEPAKADASQQQPTPSPEPLVAIAPTVRLIDPGAPPRRALRYDLKPGTTEFMQADMKMAMSMTIGGTTKPTPSLPTVRTQMRMQAKESAPDGDMRTTFTVEDCTVLRDRPTDPAMRSALEELLRGIVGMHGSASVSPRGVTKDAEFTLPPTASSKLATQVESLHDTMKNVFQPLPEEDVGVGAKWEVQSRTLARGMALDLKVIHTLRKLQRDSAQTDVETVISAPPNQSIASPDLPAGTTITLSGMSGQGKGTYALAFAHLVPSGGQTLSMDTQMRTVTAGQAVDMVMHNEITTEVRPIKAPRKR